jgi:hypothetical protein
MLPDISQRGERSVGDAGMSAASVTAALQQAYNAVRDAVELQRRPDNAIGPEAWIDELHELRMLMTATALLMGSLGLDRVDEVTWSDTGAPAPGLTPARLLADAVTDVDAARRHFDDAAASLTAVRIKLTHLR